MKLVWPAPEYLGSYVRALERGWSPNNLRPEAADEQRVQIRADPDHFLHSQVDRQPDVDARVSMPDSSTVPRMPGYRRWMWDGEFCGSIGLRWLHGTDDLPAYCLGHIGYSVVPWKRQLGYATQALRAVLREAPAEGLRRVEVTTSPDNLASQRVIRSNGGVLVEEFIKLPSLGGTPELRFVITL